jgi:hypothetical protein
MKVFISHSSTDQWIASQLGSGISALGIKVFIDVKDIETGDDFDEVIRNELNQAHEMLAVISPAALKSHWVMMEFGAARALGKRLIPILVGVSPNELPAPINRHLARDINQIDRYYDELRRRFESLRSGELAQGDGEGKSLISSPPTPQSESGPLGVGDRVRISERPIDPASWPILSETMRQYLGLTGKIAKVAETGPTQDRTFLLDVDSETFYWAERWLIRVDAEDE